MLKTNSICSILFISFFSKDKDRLLISQKIHHRCFKSSKYVFEYWDMKRNTRNVLKVSKAATGDVLWKRVFLKISQNSQENTSARAYFLIKLQASGLQLYLKKKTLARVFSCEFCKIFQKHLLRNSSERLFLTFLTSRLALLVVRELVRVPWYQCYYD